MRKELCLSGLTGKLCSSRATAMICLRERAKVVVPDISEAGGKKTVQMIRERGDDAPFVKADALKLKRLEQ
jgi:hypothetical protein